MYETSDPFEIKISRELGTIESRLKNIEDMQKFSSEERRNYFSSMESKMDLIRAEIHAHSKDIEVLKIKAAFISISVSVLVSGAIQLIMKHI